MALEWLLLVPDDGDRTQAFPGTGGRIKDGRKVNFVVGSHSRMLVTVYLQVIEAPAVFGTWSSSMKSHDCTEHCLSQQIMMY